MSGDDEPYRFAPEPPDPDEPVLDEGPEDVAVNPRRQKVRLSAAEQQSADAASFWTAVFQSDIGRREIWKVLSWTHFNEERFGASPNGAPDRTATDHERGKRDAGLHLYWMFEHYCLPGVILMREEHDTEWPGYKSKGRAK